MRFLTALYCDPAGRVHRSSARQHDQYLPPLPAYPPRRAKLNSGRMTGHFYGNTVRRLNKMEKFLSR